jgi:hypothetical protein
MWNGLIVNVIRAKLHSQRRSNKASSSPKNAVNIPKAFCITHCVDIADGVQTT